MNAYCDDRPKPIANIYNLDYLFRKSSWCVKNNFGYGIRLCKYIENIIQLPTVNIVSRIHIELNLE